MLASGFTWFNLLPQLGDKALFGLDTGSEATWLVAHTLLACLLLIALGVAARVQLNRARARTGVEKYFADDTLTARNAMEVYATAVMGVMHDMLDDKDVKAYFPFIGAMFLYIFTCNIMGIFPGFSPPTDNVNSNGGMALIVFVLFLAVAFWRDPIGYLKHLWGPMLLVGPLLFTVEVMGLLFRPVTLALRLTGNMFGDHTVFVVMSDLVPYGVPAAFLALAMFVSFMQAFIFALLTTIYIAMSVPHHEDAH